MGFLPRRPTPFRPRAKTLEGMNKTEENYAAYLEAMRRTGEILKWRFEPLKLRLADNTFYTPDFLVIYPEHIALHEVKGFWRDDARVKIKMAVELFPEFQFVAVQWKGKQGWIFEEF